MLRFLKLRFMGVVVESSIFLYRVALMPPRIESGPVDPADHQQDMASAAAAQSVNMQIPAIVPAQTALVVMHYQTDILELFPSVAPTLLANTRKLCDAARAKSVSVYFAKIQFSPGYPEVSPLNRNGQGIKQLGLFVDDKIAPELGQQATEPLIIAHRASVFFGTELQALLSAQGIDTLLMVGHRVDRCRAVVGCVCERCGLPLIHGQGLLLRPGSGRARSSFFNGVRFAHNGALAR